MTEIQGAHHPRRENAPEPDEELLRAADRRLVTVDSLRGIASLAVCWYHLTEGYPREGLLKRSGSAGWIGVEIFFVISGFIIPWTLSRSGYRLSDFRVFVWKRIVRLDPPYLASILLILAIGFMSAVWRGTAGTFSVSIPGLAAHLAYANVIFGFPWLNPVYWTLAVEFQYYLLIGLAYPWLKRVSAGSVLATASIVCLAAVALPHPRYIFHYLPLFYMGVIAFYVRSRRLSAPIAIPLLVCFAAVSLPIVGFWQAIAGLATSLVIAFTNFSWRPLVYLGTISYSLYLLHAPASTVAFSVSRKLLPPTESSRVAGVFVALLACIIAAHLFHVFVEHPAQRWSRRIAGRKRVPEAPSGVASEH
ncbi:MAG TPA: acyltransferase [Thermoanaerobaculia bacterium]